MAAGRDITRILRAGGWDVTVRVTRAGDDVEALSRTAGEAARNAASGHSYVGAVGGDGYLAEVAAGRRADYAPLIPFPGGSGNDLCRSLGIGTDPLAWATQLAAATSAQVVSWIRPLDGMHVSDRQGQRFAVGVVSLGIDASANRVANRSWIPAGPLAYAWGATASFLGRYAPQPFTGAVDGVPRDLGGWLCSVSNTGWFGGGINIVPQSETDDGTLEVLTVGNMPRLRALPHLVRALTQRGVSDSSGVFHLYRGQEVRVTGPLGHAAHADGDVIGHVPLTIRVAPAALSVVAPPEKAAEQAVEDEDHGG